MVVIKVNKRFINQRDPSRDLFISKRASNLLQYFILNNNYYNK